MKGMQRHTIVSIASLLLLAMLVWWWLDTFELHPEAVRHSSREAAANPMLAAGRLLEQQGYKVKSTPTLREALQGGLPPGILVLPENRGLIMHDQAQKVLKWVEQGNTLIARPRRASKADSEDEKKKKVEAAKVENDPIGKRFGVELINRRSESSGGTAKDKPQAATISFPNLPYALKISPSYFMLNVTDEGQEPITGDEHYEAVHIHEFGKGHVIFIADNYFDNRDLREYDHAELLLTFAGLAKNANPSAKNAIVIYGVDVQKWYYALWDNFQLALISLLCALILFLWAAMRRFGPMLPEPELQRRSLIEHIDASGRWLWKMPGGRDILLKASRDLTNRILLRRAPELQRLTPDEQLIRLSEHCRITRQDLAQALRHPASDVPLIFTRQIQTLQQVRKAYER